MHSGAVIESKDGVEIIECTICKYSHVNPLPSTEEIRRFYQDEYYDTEKPSMLEDYRLALDWFNQMYDDRLEFFEAHVGDRRRLLDIGAGGGYFLKRGKDRGWEVLGVEPSRSACEYASQRQGVEMVHGLFDEIDHEALGTFAAISLSEVLEHSLYPRKILRRCHEIIDASGVLFIMVPNDFNPLQEVYAKYIDVGNAYWVVPHHHYNYFTRESITSVLNMEGFEVVYEEVSFPMELFLLAGLDYVKDRESLGKQCHDHVKKVEMGLIEHGYRDVKRSIYHQLAQTGVGRDLMIYARKA